MPQQGNGGQKIEKIEEEEVLALENKLDKRNVSDKVKENIWTELRIKKQQIEKIITYKTQRGYSQIKIEMIQ